MSAPTNVTIALGFVKEMKYWRCSCSVGSYRVRWHDVVKINRIADPIIRQVLRSLKIDPLEIRSPVPESEPAEDRYAWQSN